MAPPNNNAVSILNTPAVFKFELDSRFVFSTMDRLFSLKLGSRKRTEIEAIMEKQL